MMNSIRCSTIRAQLELLSPSERWSLLAAQLSALEAHWIRLVQEMSRRLGEPEDKVAKHLQTIPDAVVHFDDWHFRRRKKVAARANEIYSAANYLTSRAELLNVRTWTPGGSAKNLGNLWKICRPFVEPSECTATGVAGALFRVATVRSLFPMDPFDFHQLLSPDANWHRPGDDIDNLHLMIERGAARFDLDSDLATFNRELGTLWEYRNQPREFLIEDFLWRGTRPIPVDKAAAPDLPVPFHAANELKRLLKELVIPLLAANGFKGTGNQLKRRTGSILTEVQLENSSNNTHEHASFTMSVIYTISSHRSIEPVSGGFGIGRVLPTNDWDYWYDVGMPSWLRRHVNEDSLRYDPNDLEAVRNTLRTDIESRLIPVLCATSTPSGLYKAAAVLDMTRAQDMRELLV